MKANSMCSILPPGNSDESDSTNLAGTHNRLARRCSTPLCTDRTRSPGFTSGEGGQPRRGRRRQAINCSVSNRSVQREQRAIALSWSFAQLVPNRRRRPLNSPKYSSS